MPVERDWVDCPVCMNRVFGEPVKLSPQQESCRNNVPDELPYLGCLSCGLWIQPDPPDFRYEAEDEAGIRKESMLEEKGHYEWLSNRLCAEYKPQSVLDIGSNYPIMLQHMHEVNGVPRILAIDGCMKLVDYARELGVPYVHDDFLDYTFLESENEINFDMITMVHVIEHFTNPMLAVLKMKKLLKPGGRVFIRTPLNDTEGLTRWHLTKYHLQVHPIVFGQHSIKKLFQTAGFKLLKESVGNGVGHGDYDFQAR